MGVTKSKTRQSDGRADWGERALRMHGYVDVDYVGLEGLTELLTCLRAWAIREEVDFYAAVDRSYDEWLERRPT